MFVPGGTENNKRNSAASSFLLILDSLSVGLGLPRVTLRSNGISDGILFLLVRLCASEYTLDACIHLHLSLPLSLSLFLSFPFSHRASKGRALPSWMRLTKEGSRCTFYEFLTVKVHFVGNTIETHTHVRNSSSMRRVSRWTQIDLPFVADPLNDETVENE